MNQKEVLLVLKEKNNLKINSFLRKSALYKALQRIGFLGIPTGIIGAACLVSVNVSGSLISGTNMQQQNVGLGFVALGAACLGSGVYFNIERKKNYKKAIRKYNQLYN